MADCIFCKIAQKQIPAKVAAESENWIAFHDVNPQAPVHILVIPKRHVTSLAELTDASLAGELLSAARSTAQAAGLAENGYRVVANTGNHGGQTVFHLHLHVLGGRHMGWPPG